MKRFAIMACLFLAACQPETTETGSGQATDDAAACQAEGGTVVRGLGPPVCARPTPDAGQSCTDSRQCVGLCRAPGQCSALTIEFGCFELLEDGKPVTLCID